MKKISNVINRYHDAIALQIAKRNHWDRKVSELEVWLQDIANHLNRVVVGQSEFRVGELSNEGSQPTVYGPGLALFSSPTSTGLFNLSQNGQEVELMEDGFEISFRCAITGAIFVSVKYACISSLTDNLYTSNVEILNDVTLLTRSKLEDLILQSVKIAFDLSITSTKSNPYDNEQSFARNNDMPTIRNTSVS